MSVQCVLTHGSLWQVYGEKSPARCLASLFVLFLKTIKAIAHDLVPVMLFSTAGRVQPIPVYS